MTDRDVTAIVHVGGKTIVFGKDWHAVLARVPQGRAT